MRKVPITTEYIKLDALIKYTGVCGTGGEAKAVIQEGMVTVNGEVCTQRGKKLVKGDKIQFDEEEIEVIAK